MTEQNNQIQDKKIILVLDTSWLMEIGKKDYNVLMDLLKPPEVEIRIHNRVFKELDGLKNVEGKSLQARRATRFIEEALNIYDDRVCISDFWIKRPAEKFASALQSEVDAIVLTLAEQSKIHGESIIFTTDRNQRILADKEKIRCESPLTETDIYFVFDEPFDVEKENFNEYNIYSPLNKKDFSGFYWVGVILMFVFPFLIPLFILAWIVLDIYKNKPQKLRPYSVQYDSVQHPKTYIEEDKPLYDCVELLDDYNVARSWSYLLNDDEDD